MTTPSLSRLTVQTMANYRVAATQMVAASGAGSRRFVRAVDGAIETQLLARAAKLAPKPAERMDELRGGASRMVVKGIDQFEKAAETTIVRGSEFAVAQVARLADMAAEAKPAVFAEGLHTAARLSIPAAQLALMVSSKVAEGATSLADVAGAHPVRRAVRKTAKKTKPARRSAVKTKARVSKAAAEVVKAPRVQRARRAVKKAVEQVAAA